MKRTIFISGVLVIASLTVSDQLLWARGGLGGGGIGGGGGGGFRGGGGGGLGGGGGFSGGGFRPSAPAARPSMPRPSAPQVNRGGAGIGGAGGGGRQISPGAVHTPGAAHPGGFGNRPQINPGGGIGRGDLGAGGNRSNLAGATQRPGVANNGRPGAGSLPGFKPDAGVRPGAGGAGTRIPDRNTANLPGLGGGGAGTRNNNIANNNAFNNRNINNANINNRDINVNNNTFNRGTVSERSNDLASRFDNHYGDSDWHHQQWTGPNGGTINHVGFWGPNGYWGHTGAWGPNGGHWGRSTGIGPNGAYSRTTGIGPNGAVWGHAAGVGPNGAFGYAGYSGPAGQWSRNWGGWYNGYGPAWGYGRWDYLWNQYPAAMAFGCTMWGISAINTAFGVGSYSNPYCDGPVSYGGEEVADYSQPVSGDPAYQQGADAAADPGTDPTATDTPPPDPLTEKFDQAWQAFYDEQFDQALTLTNEALAKAPLDAAINEFRSLSLFSLGKYREAAANIHAVLAAGPGWDWTTMISLYSKKETYETQLRALEAAVRANPQSADNRFLLAYHYLTAGHKDEAVSQWKKITELEPNDQLSAELVKMYAPPSDTPETPAAVTTTTAPPVDKPAFPMEKLQASWKSTSDKGEFVLTLGQDDSFTWEFKRDGKDQKVTGAYVVRGNNLVMQPESGGVMVSTIDLKNDSTLSFQALEDKNTLTFKKS